MLIISINSYKKIKGYQIISQRYFVEPCRSIDSYYQFLYNKNKNIFFWLKNNPFNSSLAFFQEQIKRHINTITTCISKRMDDLYFSNKRINVIITIISIIRFLIYRVPFNFYTLTSILTKFFNSSNSYRGLMRLKETL